MKQISPSQKGLITGALMVVTSLFSLYILKNPVESYFQFIVYTIFCGGIVWSLFNYLKTAVEKKTFKDYFSIGFKTFIVITLVMALFTYLYFSFNTGFRDTKIAENSRLLSLQGDHLPMEIEENSKQLRKIFIPMMVSFAAFRYLILGTLIAFIFSIFASTIGRIDKKIFWRKFLTSILINSILTIICSIFSILPLPTIINSIIFFITIIGTFLIQCYIIIIGIKRMHDINKSGLYFIIPIYNIVLAIKPGTVGRNQYGIDPQSKIE